LLQAPPIPAEIIAHEVWLYFHLPLSLRLVEEMLFERGIVVSYETIRRWAIKFGADYVRRHCQTNRGWLFFFME
jgi:putative transposase